LYLLIVVVGTLMGFYWPTIRLDPKYLVALLLFYANIFCQHYLWMGVGCLAPLWSISVEAQFYVAIAFAAKLSRRSLAIGCVLVIAAAYILLLHFGRAHHNPVFQIWPNTLVQFQFFAAGAAIALVLIHRRLALALPWRAAFVLMGFALFYVAAIRCHIHSAMPSPAPSLVLGYLCELTGVTVIFLAVLHLPLAIPRWLSYLGKISYGLYGFHPLLLWFTFSSTGALSPAVSANRHPVIASLIILAGIILLATVSYEFFEKPILRRKQRFEVEKTRI
jgi:peptidoglycan/LPS O-acetylase OafA/YrhL